MLSRPVLKARVIPEVVRSDALYEDDTKLQPQHGAVKRKRRKVVDYKRMPSTFTERRYIIFPKASAGSWDSAVIDSHGISMIDLGKGFNQMEVFHLADAS